MTCCRSGLKALITWFSGNDGVSENILSARSGNKVHTIDDFFDHTNQAAMRNCLMNGQGYCGTYMPREYRSFYREGGMFKNMQHLMQQIFIDIKAGMEEHWIDHTRTFLRFMSETNKVMKTFVNQKFNNKNKKFTNFKRID